MPSKFSSGKKAIAICDRCGFMYKLKELRKLTIKTKQVNIMVCNSCWEPDQPQLSLGMYPVNDPQALRDPRGDSSYLQSGYSGLQLTSSPPLTSQDAFGTAGGGSRVFQWGWAPVGGAASNDSGLTPNYLNSVGAVGTVMINVAAWDAAVNYAQSTPVSYSGGYYLAIKSNTNHVPTDITYWVVN